MPSFVIAEKCDGCKGQDRKCYNCVKICPQQAIEVRCYADFAPLGAACIPLRGSDTIMWTIKFRDGMIKRFKFPIRTTVEGQLDIYAGVGAAKADVAKIKQPGFYTQQAAGAEFKKPE